MSREGVIAGIVCAALCSGACGGRSPTRPASGVLVTFAIADETFRVWLTAAEQIAAARAAQQGGRARIPNGRIVSGTQINAGWSWHIEDMEFVEFTIELCDGRPSDVEREGTSFGGGRFCPWTARVVRLEGR